MKSVYAAIVITMTVVACLAQEDDTNQFSDDESLDGGRACESDNDCRPGRCSDKVCVQCISNSDCGGTWGTCSNNQCVP